MGGERYLGHDIQIQRDVQLAEQAPKVPNIGYTQTPSSENAADIEPVRQALSSYQTESQSDPEEEFPQSFQEICAPYKSDSSLQRMAKWYLRHNGKPEKTMKVLEKLQVHRFQEVPKRIARYFIGRKQTTQTLGQSQLSSLIDYATDKTLYLEKLHIGLGALSLYHGITYALGINGGSLTDSSIAVLANTYCILAQRYSRARCERLIDIALKNGKSIDKYEYNNNYNLNLPIK